jgi:hypothetical protein
VVGIDWLHLRLHSKPTSTAGRAWGAELLVGRCPCIAAKRPSDLRIDAKRPIARGLKCADQG